MVFNITKTGRLMVHGEITARGVQNNTIKRRFRISVTLEDNSVE
jgi:hypothetical protein